MKAAPALTIVLACLMAETLAAPSQDAAKPGPAGPDVKAGVPPGDDAAKSPELRRPGFVFLELGTRRIDESIAFFQSVAGFRLTRRDGRYAELNTGVAELLLVDPELLPVGHPFQGKLAGSGQGLGVEIGLVVADLDQTFAALAQHKDWKVSTGIMRRPWGVRDFRVLSPEGYYLRFTEPPR
jgi:catechol 2,3-dioxygenase-like lactoylglutathione lyase family enzyme